MVVKVFDAYIEGEKKATGTIDEIADYFDISRSSISLWIKNGKDQSNRLSRQLFQLLFFRLQYKHQRL